MVPFEGEHIPIAASLLQQDHSCFYYTGKCFLKYLLMRFTSAPLGQEPWKTVSVLIQVQLIQNYSEDESVCSSVCSPELLGELTL